MSERVEKILGALLCTTCGERIGLAKVPDAVFTVKDKKTGEIIEVRTKYGDLTCGTSLQDIIGEEKGMFVLRCGHLHAGGPLLSNQEWLIVDGKRVEGESAIGMLRGGHV
jgi:hypothetical protein